MARLPIPDFGTEYPEYEYREFPKYVGLDEQGDALIANSEEDVCRLKELAVYPKLLGKDRDGKDVVAQNARDEQWFASRVVKSDNASATNALTDEQPRRGPGRPPKIEAA